MSDKKKVNSILTPNARLVETILFLENDSVSKDKLLRMTNLKEEELFVALDELEQHFETFMHGIVLSAKHDRFQFLPSKDLHNELKKCYGKKVDKRLSKAGT